MKELFRKILLDNKFPPLLILALEGVIDKESGWVPKHESNYTTTSNNRIREVFPSFFGSKSDSFINGLKNDPITFFNYIYGGRFGNSKTEGYKYRGTGLNQLTFKGNFQRLKDSIGVDVVSNPDLLLQPTIAAKAAAQYFIDEFKNHSKTVKTPLEAAVLAVSANMSFPNKVNAIMREDTKEVLKYMEDNKDTHYKKKKSLVIPLIISILILLILFKF